MEIANNTARDVAAMLEEEREKAAVNKANALFFHSMAEHKLEKRDCNVHVSRALFEKLFKCPAADVADLWMSLPYTGVQRDDESFPFVDYDGT